MKDKLHCIDVPEAPNPWPGLGEEHIRVDQELDTLAVTTGAAEEALEEEVFDETAGES